MKQATHIDPLIVGSKNLRTESIEGIHDLLKQGKALSYLLPNGNRLHMDRPLPFLVVYRTPPDRPDLGT